ncbi:MAG: hypothetical protein R3D57_10600 [Hyphomicrobiaceae bacterium]
MAGGDMLSYASSMFTAVMVVGLALAGCAGGPQVSGVCLDDSQGCVDKRVSLVNQMASDPNRSWINRPGSAAEHHSGVRLFAYQRTKDQLSCDELARGIADLGNAKQVLASGPPPGGSAERTNAVKAMTDDVRAQLERQRKKKGCA